MTVIHSLVCLLCTFISCTANICDAAPVLHSTLPSPSPLLVNTSFGPVVGTSSSYGGSRFTLPYAAPPVGSLRFASPSPLSSLPSSPYDATHLPKACMQTPDPRYNITAGDVNEDCLCLNVYRPAKGGEGLPVMVWVHGGSFTSGSLGNPGLDGSWLASQGVVVVTVQYRLGMFGWFSTSSMVDSGELQGNQGVRDVIAALQFVHSHISSFGGDPNSVTLAGQSSGAHLIRSLLNSPSASPLFQRAILHSDPANFGTQTQHTSDLVSQWAMEQTSCSDLKCLRGMSAEDMLAASVATVNAGQGIDPSVAQAEVWRPFLGDLTGSAFEKDPGSSLAAAQEKEVIFTTVENESGSVVGNMLLPTTAGAESAELRAYPVSLNRQQLLEQMFNANRSSTLSSAPQYSLNFSTSADSLRQNLEKLLTQGMFTCPTWFNAHRYPHAYVGLFERGMTYPSNSGNDYCVGKVCHEDDILLLFSDPAKVAKEVRGVVKEVQARWVAFVKSGSPNAGSWGGWEQVGSSEGEAKVLRLGALGVVKTQGSKMDTISLESGQYAGCGQVWGGEVEYDWQLYG